VGKEEQRKNHIHNLFFFGEGFFGVKILHTRKTKKMFDPAYNNGGGEMQVYEGRPGTVWESLNPPMTTEDEYIGGPMMNGQSPYDQVLGQDLIEGVPGGQDQQQIGGYNGSSMSNNPSLGPPSYPPPDEYDANNQQMFYQGSSFLTPNATSFVQENPVGNGAYQMYPQYKQQQGGGNYPQQQQGSAQPPPLDKIGSKPQPLTSESSLVRQMGGLGIQGHNGAPVAQEYQQPNNPQQPAQIGGHGYAHHQNSHEMYLDCDTIEVPFTWSGKLIDLSNSNNVTAGLDQVALYPFGENVLHGPHPSSSVQALTKSICLERYVSTWPATIDMILPDFIRPGTENTPAKFTLLPNSKCFTSVQSLFVDERKHNIAFFNRFQGWSIEDYEKNRDIQELLLKSQAGNAVRHAMFRTDHPFCDMIRMIEHDEQRGLLEYFVSPKSQESMTYLPWDNFEFYKNTILQSLRTNFPIVNLSSFKIKFQKTFFAAGSTNRWSDRTEIGANLTSDNSRSVMMNKEHSVSGVLKIMYRKLPSKS